MTNRLQRVIRSTRMVSYEGKLFVVKEAYFYVKETVLRTVVTRGSRVGVWASCGR